MTNGDKFDHTGTGAPLSTHILEFGGVTDGLSNTMFASETGTRQLTNTDIRGAANEHQISSATATTGNGGFSNYTTSPQNCYNMASGKRYRNLGAFYTKGQAWGNAEGPRTLFVTVIPPNGPSCLKHDDMRGFSTASSYHSGGVNAALCDGAVRFVTDTVSASTPGTQGQNGYLGQDQPGADGTNPVMYTGASTYGVWGAYGSIAGSDSTAL